MNEKEFEITKKRWANLIGEFIVEFAEIESNLSFILLKDAKEKLMADYKLPFNFSAKLRRATEVLQTKMTESEYKKYTELKERIEELVEDRNLIAHNTLSITVLINAKEEVMLGDYVIARDSDVDTYITNEMLKECTKKVAICSKELTDMLVNAKTRLI
jgi:hypothetical protein